MINIISPIIGLEKSNLESISSKQKEAVKRDAVFGAFGELVG